MLNRIIHKDIKKWILSGDKALLISGARQVGKTSSIIHCLNETNSDYVEFNFIEQPELIEVFSSASNFDNLIERINFASPKKLKPKKTIIFLDEVQECEEMLTMIKFLVKDGSFRFILSGSLLGVELNNLRSAPVGFLHFLKMYPLSLREFYMAMGVSEKSINNLFEAYKGVYEVDSYINKKMMEFFYTYLIVGGMPEVVQSYVLNKDLKKVRQIQDEIVKAYEIDFTKCEKQNSLFLKDIYHAIPSELNKQNKRFYINKLGDGQRFSRYQNSFLWLKDAGVALPAYNISEPVVPLIMSENRNLFKLFMSDIGLLTSRFSKDVSFEILKGNPMVNKGSLYENVVAQELYFKMDMAFYYNSKKFGEVDFIVENKFSVLPIEIKSGKDYKKHSAINNLLSTDNFNIEKAMVLHNGNVKKMMLDINNKYSKQINYFPIYMIMFLDL